MPFMPVDFSRDPEFTSIAYAEPTPDALTALEAWLSRNQSTLVRMYHGTRASYPVETQGLLPTSKTRRNSLQSRSGYVSLTIYPGMARTFAKMAFPRDEIVVYAVDIPVNLLVPDKDQLRNQRVFAGRSVKDTLAHSLAFGHGAQVKGSIIPARITKTNESFMPTQLNEYKYCSTQINLNGLAATRALMAGDMIPDDALGVEGREKQPHLTVQYGIETDNPDAVAQAIGGIRPFEITLGDTDAFPPSEHSSGDSPLFARVISGESELVALRNAVRSAGSVHDSFPKYVPHMNLAYVKNDRVEEFCGKDWLRGTKILVSGVTFSNRDGTHTYLPFGVSESVLPQINSLLDRLSESSAEYKSADSVELAAQAAAKMTRKQYDASEFPSTVMSYDIARAAARDRGLTMKKNIDVDSTPDNPGTAILKMIDDLRVARGGKRKHTSAYKPRRTVN